MRWSWNVGKFAGINVKIHWTFILILAWVAFIELQRGGSLTRVLFSLGLVLAVFFCVVLHEYGHALTARRYGIGTDKITLLPIGGVASIKRMPENPKHELLIAIAGPAVNVVIALLLAVFLPLQNLINQGPEVLLQSASVETFFLFLLWINIILVVFNVIPAFPMDGGRVLRAILAMKMQRTKATNIASKLGQLLAVGFIVAGLFYSVVLILIGIFVFFGAYSENTIVQQLEYLKHYSVREAVIKNIVTLSPESPVEEAVEKIKNTSEHNFVITKDESVVGIIDIKSIMAALKERRGALKIGEIMKRHFATLNPDEALNNVFSRIQSEKQSFYPVINNGHLEGVITLKHLNDFFMLKSAEQGDID